MSDNGTIIVTLYESKPGRFTRRPQKWRWRAVAPNNRVLADSGEAYRAKPDALHAIWLLFGAGTDVLLRQPGQDDEPLRWA